MDLTQLGLSPKESRIYNELLMHGPATVRELGEMVGEQRTNCYLILRSLEKRQLVVRDGLQPILKFRVADPRTLKTLLAQRQIEIQGVSNMLTKSMPKLASLYRLTTERQGLAYFNNAEGLQAVHDDMLAVGDTVRSFISETIVQNQPGVYRTLIKESVAKRSRLGVASQFIACKATEPYLTQSHFTHDKVAVRVLDADIFDGEITIYGDKLALTSYAKGSLQTIVVSDPALATTFRAIFESCWKMASTV
jgi:sugar-specific transcriptional regulator TrmB